MRHTEFYRLVVWTVGWSWISSEFWILIPFLLERKKESVRPHGLSPARLLCPLNSPGKNTGVDSHSLLQGIFPTQWSNLRLPHCRPILYHLSHQGYIWVIHKTGKICISTIYCIPVSVSLFHNSIPHSFAKIVPLGKLGKGDKVSPIVLPTVCNYTINSMKKKIFLTPRNEGKRKDNRPSIKF